MEHRMLFLAGTIYLTQRRIVPLIGMIVAILLLYGWIRLCYKRPTKVPIAHVIRWLVGLILAGCVWICVVLAFGNYGESFHFPGSLFERGLWTSGGGEQKENKEASYEEKNEDEEIENDGSGLAVEEGLLNGESKKRELEILVQKNMVYVDGKQFVVTLEENPYFDSYMEGADFSDCTIFLVDDYASYVALQRVKLALEEKGYSYEEVEQ